MKGGPLREPENACTCTYRQTCHFFNIAQKNDHSTHLFKLYCVEWPEQCLIHQKRKVGAPVSMAPLGLLGR